jgi:cobalamin biosynthetic protein CobC
MIVSGDADQTVVHGGDLAAARRRFPGAPEPFVDLSTGINPWPYPQPRLLPALYARLPEPDAAAALAEVAAQAFGAPSAAHVAPAPGTQILLPMVAGLVPPGRAAILTPTYPEFARAAALAGHAVEAARTIDECSDAGLVIMANPNNPDGRVVDRQRLRALAGALGRRGGLLVVDEAFMEVGPAGVSLAADVGRGNMIVLRSFGKFYGLAGLRLGFALAAPPMVARLRAALGPWAVSAPALAAGTKALADAAWQKRTRERLATAAGRLDTVLTEAGLEIVGGTTLFRLARTPTAGALFDHLGRAGILVRVFPEQRHWVRFGLPANAPAWQRLRAALTAFPRPQLSSRA